MKPTTTQWVDVTPAIAEKWLETYNTKNRPVKDSVVKKYARDMREGRWLDKSAEPIIFDWEGVLVDGQHRLWAVFESGITITFLVVENADPRQRQVTDIGAPRNVKDILSFEGLSAPFGAIAIARRMLEGFNSHTNISVPEQREAYLRHQQAVHWVLSTFNCNQKGLKSAPVLAPVARAYYSQDRDRLTRFLEVLRNGVMDGPEDIAAVHLRNWAITQSQSGRTGGGQAAVEMYGKSERALVAFLACEHLTRLYGCTEEQFPIAEDSPKAKKRLQPAKVVKMAKSRK